MSQDLGGFSLYDLFKEEVAQHGAVLTEGLLGAERRAGDAKAIEPLMRAAHSIKGAARIVGLDAVIDLSHAMEDHFVAAQKGEIKLTSEAVDVLLRGVDLIMQVSQLAEADTAKWLEEHAAEMKAVATDLSAVGAGGEVAKAEMTAPPAEPVPIAEPTPQTVNKDEPENERERVLRVSASNLNRLMALAGESLVEARWLDPFSAALQKIKRNQTRLAASLEEFHDALQEAGADSRWQLMAGDALALANQLRQSLIERADEFDTHAHRATDLTGRLYDEAIKSRMRPFADGVQAFPRMVRDLARRLGKEVDFQILGQDTDVDRDILEKLEAPLTHLLRNALDHGVETPAERTAAGKPPSASLHIEAHHRGGLLHIVVSDDGRGIDPERVRRKVVERGMTSVRVAADLSLAELMEFLFLPGFSTADNVTELSGRGVGLDVVHNMVQAVGGIVRCESTFRKGTRFHLELPVTLSVIRAMLVKVAGEPFAFPLAKIEHILRVPIAEVEATEQGQQIQLDGQPVGLVTARQVFAMPDDEQTGDNLCVVLIREHDHTCGLVVDDFLGEQDLVIRPLDPRLRKVPDIQASALLDDGTPVLIVDVDDIVRSIDNLLHGGRLTRITRSDSKQRRTKRVLVVDDSITVREAERQLLAGRGYEVDVAVDGMDGWNAARGGEYDLIISDIDMPRMNGIELVKMIKANPALRNTPVVIVSYKDREEDRLAGMAAGANHYLTKSSFHDETLVRVVADLIGEAV